MPQQRRPTPRRDQPERRTSTPSGRGPAPRPRADGGLATRRQALAVLGAMGLGVTGAALGLGGVLSGGCASQAPTAEAAAEPSAAAGAEVAEASGSYADVPVRLLDEGRTTASGTGRLSFSAWGDVIATDYLLEDCAGPDGRDWDFSGLFSQVAPWVKSRCDVSLVNMETTMGGTDNGFDIAGYPSFNTPDSMADAIADAGFRVVACDSNHTYDTWVASIEHAQEVWEAKTGLLTIGSFADAQDRAVPRVVECNGVRLAFLAYSYGQNGYELSDLPNDWYAVPWDEAAMRQEVARAQEACDAVVVYLHMGTEYTNEPNEQQREAFQAAADAGAALVVGSHSHVIQPVEALTTADGRRVLAAYGLGDLVSGYPNNPPCVLSGAFCCTFARREDGSIAVEDPVWRTVIEHKETAEDGTVQQASWLLADYTAELAEKNELLASLEDPWQWLQDEPARVMAGAPVRLT